MTNSSPTGTQVLFKVLPITLHSNVRSIDTYAFIDEGSSATLLDEDLADQLGLQGDSESLTLQWLNDEEITQDSRRVVVDISERGPAKKFTLQNVQTVKGISLPMQTLDLAKLSNKYKVIKNLPIKNYENAIPKILIGLNNLHVAFQSQSKICSKEGPIAVKTKLGWLVYGTVKDFGGAATVYNNLVRVLTIKESNSMDYICNQMKEYFSTEGFGCVPKRIVQSTENIQATKILVSTTRKINSRYETGLLWKINEIQMPESKATAARRLELATPSLRCSFKITRNFPK